MDDQRSPLPRWLRTWVWLRTLGRVLWLARFSVAFTAIGTSALLFNDQAQEVLREFAARRGDVGDFIHLAILLLATLLWCWNAWAWARMLTSLRMPGTPAPGKLELAMRVIVPRVLGAIAAFAVPTAMWMAATAYADFATPFALQLRIVAGIMFVGAIAFVGFIVFRRRFAWFGVRRNVEEAAIGQLTWLDLPIFDRLTLWITAGATVALFTLFAIDAATTAPWFGAAPILLAALAAWIPFGSLLVWLSNRWQGVPLFALFLLAAVVFGMWNDNHAVRTLAGTIPASTRAEDCDPPAEQRAAVPATRPRYPLCAYAKRWLTERKGEIATHRMQTGGAYPVYLVAASGGGIRAAYWTAALLGFRHDLDSTFARRTFAISGVSGGSLGAMAYVGLLRAQGNGKPAPNCGGRYALQPTADCVSQFLAGDFLAPTLGALLYPDLVARFVPFPVEHFDRARAMERGWELRWASIMRGRGDDWFAASYEGLTDPEPRPSPAAIPLLLLNVTTVEGGKRALLSPLPVRPREFPDTVDLRAQIGHPLPNSAAAHLSARFMYVSPAATVVAPEGGTAGHLVDGGYFENSGATTLLDVLVALQAAARESGFAADIRPVAIVIENDPYADAPADVDPPTMEQARALSWLVETRSPPVTLLHTRDARGTLAQAALRRAVLWPGAGLPPGTFEFYRPSNAVHELLADPATTAAAPPSPQRIPLPLGWMLSDPARMVLDQQVVRQTCLRHPALC